MTNIVTFDGQPPEGTINLGVGQPSADLLPVDLVKRASEAYFVGAEPLELNYGVVQGDPRFLDTLAGFLSSRYGAPAASEQLFVTGGNSQGLDLSSFVFANAADTVFVEEPSYFLAFQILRDHGLNIVSIPMDDEGPSLDALRRELKHSRPAFFYTIPSYHNPCGLCTSEARRRAIVELAIQHDFLIVADEVYQLLYYYDSPPPAYGTMTSSGKVVSLGSFSKILAPAMRLGWIQASEDLIARLVAAGYVNSGGSLNHISSHIVRHSMINGTLESHIQHLRNSYRSRAEAMDDALHRYFDGAATWTRPEGGYFVWMEFDSAVDTTPLKEKAGELQTGFQHGEVFSISQRLNHCLRLCFAHYNEEDIREGIARMRPLFD